MASVLHEKKLKRWRISFALRLPACPVYRSRYARDRAEADQLRRQLEAVETATRTGLAKASLIEEWIARGWLKPEEALGAFPAWREAGGPTLRRPVDLEALRRAYEDYALQHSKAGSPFRASHKSHLALAGQVLAWLEEAHPRLDLSPADVERWLAELGRKYAPWSVYHYGTYLRLLLDRAVELGMAPSNVARAVSLSTPRTRQERRVLSAEEVAVVLEASARPPYSTMISGCLGTAVRLGLYAGLRNEEMARARWEWLDFRRRILTVQASGDETEGERWSPKDHEARRLDVKEELVEYLQQERTRQQEAGLLGPYVIVAGHARLPHYRGRPIGSKALTRAFAAVVTGEKLHPDLTLYCLRHTYASALLRAGVDLRTVQARLGHSDLKTTMTYLHALEAEAHPTDALPY